MKTTITTGCFIFITAVHLTPLIHGQTTTSGSTFISALGKSSNSQEVMVLIEDYHLEKANDKHYVSKEGVELILNNEVLTEVRLYQNSAVFGKFTHTLPYGLQFGASLADLRKLLGKPTLSYQSSGYSEFEKGGVIIACWFEEGVFCQISLSLK